MALSSSSRTVSAKITTPQAGPRWGRRGRLGLLALALAAFARGAGAQPPPPPGPGWALPPPPYAAPLQVTGEVAHMSLTPRGDVDGVILADGTLVHTPPHLGPQLIAAIRVGDRVAIQGWRDPSSPVVHASVITDQVNGQSVADTGPPPPGARPLPPFAAYPQPMTVQGRVKLSLYGPRGDLNGALLEDGTQLHLPPPIAAQYAPLLTPGAVISASGEGLVTPYGRVLEAMGVLAAGPASAPPPPYAPPAPGAAPVPPGGRS